MNTSQGPTSKLQTFFSNPFFIVIVCFLIVIMSINGIINLAQQKPLTLNKEVKENQAIVNQLLQSTEPLTYNNLNQKIAMEYPTATQLQAQLKQISPTIEQLPPSEQNHLLRANIAEFGIEQIINLISESQDSNQGTLIFKLWFWIYSILIWAGSIVGGQILTFHTDKLIHKFWGKDKSH